MNIRNALLASVFTVVLAASAAPANTSKKVTLKQLQIASPVASAENVTQQINFKHHANGTGYSQIQQN